MASTKLMTTKDGRRFWKISVSRGYGLTPYTQRFYWPEKADGQPVAKRTAERELDKAVAEFERACAAGEVHTRAQKKEKAAAEAAEAAKIRTFRQYGDSVFMPAKTITCAEKTRKYYQDNLTNHLYPVLGDIPIPDITSAKLSSLFLRLQKGPLSHSTVLGIYVTCNQLFKMAYMDDSINRNPMDKVQRPKQRKDEQKNDVPHFTVDELRTIFGYLENEPLKWRAMIHLMVDTGIRRGEACGLQWSAIDLHNNSAVISQNVGYSPEKGIYITTPKTGKTREVYFTNETASLLRALRKEQLENCGSPFVFNQDGLPTPMHPDSPNRYLHKFGEKYGIEIRPHMLRHPYVKLTTKKYLLQKQKSQATVADNLGFLFLLYSKRSCTLYSISIRLSGYTRTLSIRRSASAAVRPVASASSFEMLLCWASFSLASCSRFA